MWNWHTWWKRFIQLKAWARGDDGWQAQAQDRWPVLLPLLVALIAALLAAAVALWATWGFPAAFLFRWTGAAHPDSFASFWVGSFAIVATAAALLAGVGEVYILFPSQKIALSARGENQPNHIKIGVDVQNLGGYVTSYAIHVVVRDSTDRVYPPWDIADGPLVPGQKVVRDVDFPHGRGYIPEEVTVVMEWATDRAKRTSSLAIPLIEGTNYKA